MVIHLKPETEAMIEQRVHQGGAYQSAEDFVEQAVALLHEQESWLAENRAQIADQIAEGYGAAQRGDLLDEDAVRSLVASKKNSLRNE
ncbi:MAG: hypothetical protein SFV51_24710 [Bryobacteraceae bacterium]|nr:hypothetical protein [Bryobacteraceae bacterium]